jgi:alkylhydroperoxidase family enzyme
VSQFPQQVDRADFNALRDQGVSDAEILELVTLTALAVASDIFADALKMPVDPMVLEALGR